MKFSLHFLTNKSMKKIFIGIDISSKTLDICLQSEQGLTHLSMANQPKAIDGFFKKLTGQPVVVAMENTGRYNWPLYQVLAQYDFQVYVLSALHLKKSLGLIRGKTDKVDAQRICHYIRKHYQDCLTWQPAQPTVQKIKVLLAQRLSRIKIKRMLIAQQAEFSLLKELGLDQPLGKLNQQLIDSLQEQIQRLEEQIQQLIQADEQTRKQAQFISSVPGVGKVTCWMMLARTEGFTLITDPRKMACYCGVVPFEHQSGSSLRRRPRVSHYADKSMKSVLHMAAMRAVRLDNRLRDYYQRKVAEGKNKMSVLNAVRNKIIHLIFALIKNQTTYQNNLHLS